MWLMGLIGVLAAAVPVAFVSPSLGFKKRKKRFDHIEEIHRLFLKSKKIQNDFRKH